MIRVKLVGLLFMALILWGAPFVSNQEVPSLVYLFIGLIMLMTIAMIVFIYTTFSGEHRALMTMGIGLLIVVVFAPCLAVFNLYDESITDGTFVRYIAVFTLAPLILGSSVIWSYRYYFVPR